MRITPGQFPQSANLINHAARAYGVKPPAAAQQPQTAAPLSFTLKPDAYEPSTPARSLVAGNVAGRVNFDSSPRSAQSTALAAYQMYTRAADKVEAAIAVQVGRTLDVKG